MRQNPVSSSSSQDSLRIHDAAHSRSLLGSGSTTPSSKHSSSRAEFEASALRSYSGFLTRELNTNSFTDGRSFSLPMSRQLLIAPRRRVSTIQESLLQRLIFHEFICSLLLSFSNVLFWKTWGLSPSPPEGDSTLLRSLLYGITITNPLALALGFHYPSISWLSQVLTQLQLVLWFSYNGRDPEKSMLFAPETTVFPLIRILTCNVGFRRAFIECVLWNVWIAFAIPYFAFWHTQNYDDRALPPFDPHRVFVLCVIAFKTCYRCVSYCLLSHSHLASVQDLRDTISNLEINTRSVLKSFSHVSRTSLNSISPILQTLGEVVPARLEVGREKSDSILDLFDNVEGCCVDIECVTQHLIDSLRTCDDDVSLSMDEERKEEEGVVGVGVGGGGGGGLVDDDDDRSLLILEQCDLSSSIIDLALRIARLRLSAISIHFQSNESDRINRRRKKKSDFEVEVDESCLGTVVYVDRVRCLMIILHFIVERLSSFDHGENDEFNVKVECRFDIETDVFEMVIKKQRLENLNERFGVNEMEIQIEEQLEEFEVFRRFLELLEGSVVIDGNVSSLRIPMKCVEIEIASPRSVLSPPSFPPVYVIEDESVNRQVMKYFLVDVLKVNSSVVLCENGKVGLDRLSEEYDYCHRRVGVDDGEWVAPIVFMDIDMPVMNGIDCTSALRSRGIPCSIFSVTASFIDSPSEFCRTNQFDGLILKPVKPSELLELFHTHRTLREEAKSRAETENELAMEIQMEELELKHQAEGKSKQQTEEALQIAKFLRRAPPAFHFLESKFFGQKVGGLMTLVILLMFLYDIPLGPLVAMVYGSLGCVRSYFAGATRTLLSPRTLVIVLIQLIFGPRDGTTDFQLAAAVGCAHCLDGTLLERILNSVVLLLLYLFFGRFWCLLDPFVVTQEETQDQMRIMGIELAIVRIVLASIVALYKARRERKRLVRGAKIVFERMVKENALILDTIRSLQFPLSTLSRFLKKLTTEVERNKSLLSVRDLCLVNLCLCERSLDNLRSKTEDLALRHFLSKDVVRPKLEQVDILKLVEDIVETQRRIRLSFGVRLHLNLPRRCHSIPSKFSTDKHALYHVIHSLLSNSLNRTTTGTVNITVHFDPSLIQFKLVVEDTGCMITKEAISRLMNDETSFEDDLLGVGGSGLQVSKGIVEKLLKGSFDCSGLDNGTICTIVFGES